MRNFGDTLVLCPPLLTSADEIVELVIRMTRVVEHTHDWIVAKELS